jgi:hypothetical protein
LLPSGFSSVKLANSVRRIYVLESCHEIKGIINSRYLIVQLKICLLLILKYTEIKCARARTHTHIYIYNLFCMGVKLGLSH